MATVSVLIVAVATFLTQDVRGQRFGFPFNNVMAASIGSSTNVNGLGSSSMNMMGRGMLGSSLWGGAPAKEYLTCIGSTASEDDMRVTFSDESRWTNWGNPSQQSSLRMSAKLTAGMNSQIQNNFQLIITENGRIEGYCDAALLGSIIDTNQAPVRGMTWWNNVQTMSSRPSGIVGSQFDLFAGQTVSMTETVNNLDMDVLAGSGMAMCPTNQLVGRNCLNPIPLCCSITKDNKPADAYPVRRLTGPPMGIPGVGGMGGMGGVSPMGAMGGNIPMGSSVAMGGNIPQQQPGMGVPSNNIPPPMAGAAAPQQQGGSMVFPPTI